MGTTLLPALTFTFLPPTAQPPHHRDGARCSTTIIDQPPHPHPLLLGERSVGICAAFGVGVQRLSRVR